MMILKFETSFNKKIVVRKWLAEQVRGTNILLEPNKMVRNLLNFIEILKFEKNVQKFEKNLKYTEIWKKYIGSIKWRIKN